MKTSNVLKTGFFAVAFALLSVGVKAQTPTTTPTLPQTATPVATYTPFTASGDESIDMVTVGSRMPYKVDAQTAITGLTFEYKWLFDAVSGHTWKIQDLGGTDLTGSADYYSANEISVVMPATTGTVKINTNVRSLSGATVLCTGTTDDVNNITVVDRPTIKWTVGSIPFCTGSVGTASIPITLTGYSQYEIKYTIKYFNTVDKSGGETSTSSPKYIVLAGNTIELPASEFASGTGVYEVSVTNITDRISRKSLDAIASTAVDLPVGAYTVVVYPTPTTKPLQHVKNM